MDRTKVAFCTPCSAQGPTELAKILKPSPKWPGKRCAVYKEWFKIPYDTFFATLCGSLAVRVLLPWLPINTFLPAPISEGHLSFVLILILTGFSPLINIHVPAGTSALFSDWQVLIWFFFPRLQEGYCRVPVLYRCEGVLRDRLCSLSRKGGTLNGHKTNRLGLNVCIADSDPCSRKPGRSGNTELCNNSIGTPSLRDSIPALEFKLRSDRFEIEGGIDMISDGEGSCWGGYSQSHDGFSLYQDCTGFVIGVNIKNKHSRLFRWLFTLYPRNA